MKKIVLILLLGCAFILGQAQEESPTLKGNSQLNFGTGVFGGSGGLNLIPVHLGMDFFIVNNLSTGFDFSWRYYASQDNVGNPSLLCLQAVIDYHFNQIMNLSNPWDFYAGFKIGTGYMTTDKDLEVFNLHYDNGFKFVFDARAGIRYYFNNNVALNSEIGVTSVSGTKTTGASFTLGITVKL
jgi:hypothetical protein